MIDLPAILKDITLTFAIIGGFVVLCSVCEELKRRYDDLNIYLCCNWYRYPIKMKHIVTVILIDSQNSDVFKIFGSLTASRETCTKVKIEIEIIGVHTSWSKNNGILNFFSLSSPDLYKISL